MLCNGPCSDLAAFCCELQRNSARLTDTAVQRPAAAAARLQVAMRALGFPVKKEEVRKILGDYDREGTGKIAFEDFVEVSELPTQMQLANLNETADCGGRAANYASTATCHAVSKFGDAAGPQLVTSGLHCR